MPSELMLDGKLSVFPDETQFEVTGVSVNGKRFPAIKTTNLRHAFGINLYRGTVWARLPGESSRKKLMEVWN